ncbi:glycoside hydrolase family 15 protein [Periconia macrospinosa]|uniref:Glycoside hydrolase family 15 protein n=1 Tax=Periconia macrospinosa TaxID=97972 RepID=A0A2V1DI30_9PLEO|nr:glycoside hydrolase family 15 protein [Periconia macrospinosa]
MQRATGKEKDVAPPERQASRRHETGYMPVEDYGLIGNMRTCALVAIDGGHFSIKPVDIPSCTTKQTYLPSSNILQTRHLSEEGVMNVIDFFPRPNNKTLDAEFHAKVVNGKQTGKAASGNNDRPDVKKWLVRRVECLRGQINVCVKVFPAFNYARDKHTTEIQTRNDGDKQAKTQKVIFRSPGLSLQLDTTIECGDDPGQMHPNVVFEKSTRPNVLGDGITATFQLGDGQAVSFILRDYPEDAHEEGSITSTAIEQMQLTTHQYWARWISQSKYHGRWEDVVKRSLFILKLLTFEPTGAIVAAPTFSLPEDFGGVRNWDYRFSWVRDSSFTIYILLRMGFMLEAEAYTSFIFERLAQAKINNHGLPIMFTIRGETDIPEIELTHLDGYRGSKPVRIGNGAASHTQLDIYGELMDGIYLANKFGKPTTYDQWLSVRDITDYVLKVWQDKDLSIWEVRGQQQNFVYSKIMMWVAVDRAIRLADKRCFPCPNRTKWYSVRDEIYDQIMEKGYNRDLDAFIQSYESNDVLDSSILIAPLVFFISPVDPRFLTTLERIMKPPEKGGLLSTGLVYRYNYAKSDDGVGGREGAFSMCTFWLVEALTRAGAYEPKYLHQAVGLFENILGFGNHLRMFSEEIARSGEQLGNTPQAFSHLGLISAAFNLERTLGSR